MTTEYDYFAFQADYTASFFKWTVALIGDLNDLASTNYRSSHISMPKKER